MVEKPQSNIKYDVSFFKIDNEKSYITFNENSDFKFNIIQNDSEENALSYKKDLTIENNELLEYLQLEVLNNKKISMFFNIIEEEICLKQMSFVKRVKKDKNKKIYVLVCSKHLFKNNDQIVKKLAAFELWEDKDYKFVETFALLPKVSPATKDICEKWSSSYWPLNWKGNNKENQLRQIYLNDFQMPSLTKFNELFDILNCYKPNSKDEKILTLFYNFQNNKVHVFQDQTRSTKFPIAHSIINGIDAICSSKEDAANEYLLQNFYVISTHEPCQMCAMALIHSRINLFLFAKSTPYGCLTNNDFCLADFSKLNWKYQVLQYDFLK